jgi:hypothetical protein
MIHDNYTRMDSHVQWALIEKQLPLGHCQLEHCSPWSTLRERFALWYLQRHCFQQRYSYILLLILLLNHASYERMDHLAQWALTEKPRPLGHCHFQDQLHVEFPLYKFVDFHFQ